MNKPRKSTKKTKKIEKVVEEIEYEWEKDYNKIIEDYEGFGFNQFCDVRNDPRKLFKKLSSMGCSIGILDYENILLKLPEDPKASVECLIMFLTSAPMPTEVYRQNENTLKI
jgi:hypothetical protein